MIDKNSLKEHQIINSEINLEFNNVGELLSKKVQENSDKVFLICPGKDDEQFTYSEFKDRVDQSARFLIKLGLKKGEKISLIFHNSSEFLILYFAGLSCGLTIVPINPDLATNEIKYIINDSDSKCVFYFHTMESKILSNIEEFKKIKLIKIESLNKLIQNFESNLDIENYDVKLNDIAVIIYTSGTTGNPKGVILNHLNLLSDAMSISNWFQFDKNTRCLCILPLFHNNGQITTLLAPLYAGGSTVIIKGKISLYAFWEIVEQYKTTWTSVMASILSILLSLPNERKDNSLKAILCGGQILTRAVQEKFESRFNVPIYEGYGLTETTSFSCINNFPAEKRKIGSIGKSLITNQMEILDKNERIIKNTEGEICIRGYNVANGYLGDSKMNYAFRNGWFHSGDYGIKDDEGNFYFHGRQDALIIKGGENIYPAEIENILYTHPYVDECAVIGIPHKLLGEEVCAFVKIKKDEKINEKELKEFCKNKIADYKQPRVIIIINTLDDFNEIPKGPTKKILYRELRKYYHDNY